MSALIVLVTLSISCSDTDDNAQNTPTPDVGETSTDSNAGIDIEEVAGGATGAPSEWYSDLDPLEAPATGSGLLTIGGETIDLEINWCEFMVSGEYVTEPPARTDADSFSAEAQLRGTLAGGQPVGVSVRRSVDPSHTGNDPYEVDTVDFSVDDGTDIRVRSRATMIREVVGGPTSSYSGTLMLKVNGTSLTSVGTAGILLSAAGDYELAIVDPFELAVACP